MNKKYLSVLILSFGIIFSTSLVSITLAQANPASSNIEFPITELGNCQSKAECKIFCDKELNRESCLNFAQKNNLMSQEETNAAKKVLSVIKGPGGCNSKELCETYCNDISHIEECVAFAETNNIMPQKELEEAKKIRQAIRSGIKPPACKNKNECDVYCSSADHMEECIVFAQSAGLMNEKEKQETQKVLQAIKKGIKPPKCRGKEECDAYCSEESHMEECVKFAEAAGFMTSKEAEMARKTKGKGPGGCRGKEECDAFCENNQEACFQFAKDNNLIKPEEMQRMEEGKQGMQRAFNEAPPKVVECINSILGTDMVSKIKEGTIMPSQKIGDTIKSCFEKMGGPQGNDSLNGPGGCSSPEECKTYCASNPQECEKYGSDPQKGGFPGPGQNNIMSPQNSNQVRGQDMIPSEVAQCLKETAGENIADQIRNGSLQPGPEINEKIKICFDKFQPRPMPNGDKTRDEKIELNENFRQMPNSPINTFKPILDGINPNQQTEFLEMSPEKRQFYEEQNKLRMQNQSFPQIPNTVIPAMPADRQQQMMPRIEPNDLQMPSPPTTQEPQQSSAKRSFTAMLINFFDGIFTDK